MSHGSTEKCEPNFTPLLDLVLQLVMFFMLCANFVLEQTSEEIKLPKAESANALDKEEQDAFYLNVNAQGKVLLSALQREGDNATLDNAEQVKSYMQRRARVEFEKKKREKPGLQQSDWKSDTTIVLRIDQATAFKDTFGIMKACRDAGYTKVQLRAIRRSGED